MVSYGGEFTLDRWLTLQARAVPFDLAHAIGNVTLALIAGPAMVRMLMRFRERFEFRWPRGARSEQGRAGLAAAPTALLVALLAVFLLAPVPATAKSPTVAWLQRAENADGGFPATPGGESSTEITAWAMLGLEAAGVNPLDVGRRGHSPVAYLRRNVSDLRSPGDLARTILALSGAGVDARHFAGHDLAARLAGKRRGNGSYQGWPNSTAFAVMALRASGAERRDRPLARLAAAGPELRWGVGGGPGLRQRRRLDRRRAAGPRRRLARRPARRPLPAPLPEAKRRLGAGRGGGRQLPVDRLGGPGPACGRCRPDLGATRRAQRPRLPRRPPRRRRPLPLLVVERPNPGLGDRPGPGGRRAQTVPAGAGAARRRCSSDWGR